MAKKRARDFSPPPELKDPIKWTGPLPVLISRGLLETDEGWAERKAAHDNAVVKASERVLWEKVRRVGVLASHMKVDLRAEHGLRDFCVALAEALCPKGFSVDFGDAKRGRKKSWTYERFCELIADVEAVKLEKGCNDTTACRTLVQRAQKAGRGRYLPSKGSNLNSATNTLLNRLSDARNPSVNRWGLMFYLVEKNAPEEAAEYERYMTKMIINVFGTPEKVRP